RLPTYSLFPYTTLFRSPTLSVDEIVSILSETATPLVDDQYRSVPNYGYGYGLVNALQAVAAVYTPKGLPVIEEPVNGAYIDQDVDRKSTRLNSSHVKIS